MPGTKEIEVTPKYSIIIVNVNGLTHTIKCIESIYEHTENFELIIVDGASTDGSVEYLDHQLLSRKNIKVINCKKLYNFSVNNNLGFKLATGDFVIFLNNDTVVTPGWVSQMENHFNNVPLENIGAVGPVCNNSNGRQMVGIQDAVQWHAEHRGQWSMSGVLYGWCIMFRKPVLDLIGGFDERFENGHEDNDLSLRAQLAGYKLVIAIDTYIYHEGQATLRKFMPSKQAYMDQGLVNRETYFNKYYDDSQSKKKLVAVYRTNYGDHFEESLEQTSRFADSIIIHFCRAPGNVYFGEENFDRQSYVSRLKVLFPKICKVEFYDGLFQEDYERNWLLQQALELQSRGLADWCISIDDDEIYEDKFIGRVQKMMNPRNPEILAYAMNWRTIWKTELGVEYYRADDTFGQFINHRFFRLIPGQLINSHGHPEGHHCGSAPHLSPENIKWTNIRVRHLGYDTPAQRQRKYDFYQKNDNFKNAADIGHQDYSHLIDMNVNYQIYDKDHSISLVTMVKNEEKQIRGMLEGIQDLVDEFVIVDTGSTDKTLSIIDDFSKYSPIPVRVFHYPWEDNYSTPRNYGKMQAKGKYILRMDADERFMYEDLTKIFNMTERDIEIFIFQVINFMEEQVPGKKPFYASTEAMRLYRNYPEIFYSGIVHETLDDSTAYLYSKRRVNIQRAIGIYLYHYGYLKTKDHLRKKMDTYEILNNRQIEITDGTDPRPYFNLALHYLNDEKVTAASQNFRKCVDIDQRFWMSYQQMAALNIKQAKNFLAQTVNTIPSHHPFKKEAEEILDFLNKRSIGCVKVT